MPIARAPAGKPAAKPAPTPVKATPAASVGLKTAKAVQTAASETSVGEERFTVTKTFLENGQIKGQPVIEENIEVRKFLTSTATAAYGFKMKRNLGNFESVEISVFGSVPCYAEDFDNTMGQTISKVEEIFNEQMSTLDVSAYQSEAEVGAGDFGGEGTEAVEQAGEATDEGEGESITEEWVDEQDRDGLIAFLGENPVEGLDPDDYPDDDDLKAMVKSAFFPEDGDGTEAGAEGTEEAPPYTQEELEQSSMDDLKQVFALWEMGAFPAYTAKNQAVVKKNAIKKIMDRQAAGG